MSHRFTFRQSFRAVDEQELEASTRRLLTLLEREYDLNDTDIVDVHGSVIVTVPIGGWGRRIYLRGTGAPPQYNVLDIAGEPINFEYVKAFAVYNPTVHTLQMMGYGAASGAWEPQLMLVNDFPPYSQYLHVTTLNEHVFVHPGIGWGVHATGDDEIIVADDNWEPSGERIAMTAHVVVAGKRR